MINPFVEESNGNLGSFICPEGTHVNPNLIVQWVHLQDGTGPAHHARHDLDTEMQFFWKDVGTFVGNKAYANVVGFRDDVEEDTSDLSSIYPRWNYVDPLGTSYIDQNEDAIIAAIDDFKYETNYDGYDSAWKVLVQAATTQYGNSFGWNQSYTEGVSLDDIVRIVTMNTPTIGKMRGDSCPDDSFYWDDCSDDQDATWHNKFRPGGTSNLPSFDDGVNQIDPDVVIKVLVTNAGTTDRDINRSQIWWARTLCRLRDRGLTNVGLVQYTTVDFFDDARAEIIRKGCTPNAAAQSKIEAPTESIVRAEDDIVQQDGLKEPTLSLDCPSGYKRKDNFLLQWMHVQDGTADSYYHRHSINDAVSNFWDRIGGRVPDKVYSSLVAYSDSEYDTMYDDAFWAYQSPFKNYSSSPKNVLDGLDNFSFDKSFDGYTGGWKALVQASSSTFCPEFGWDSTESEATSDEDKMRIITLHTHAPGKVMIADGMNKKNYCGNSHEWRDCYNDQVNSKWKASCEPLGKYNLPGLSEGIDQMDKTANYVFLISHTRDTHEFYSDAKSKWNDVACYMKAHGFSVRVLDDSPRMFDDLYEEFVRKSCTPI